MLGWLLLNLGRYLLLLLLLLMLLLVVQRSRWQVTVLDHNTGSRKVSIESDPMDVPVQLSRNWRPAAVEGLPDVFTGGLVGYAGYDTVRYVYGSE